jgi:hypothetical protein
MSDSPYVSFAVLQARYERKLKLAAKTNARNGAIAVAAFLVLLGVTAVLQFRKSRPAAPVPAAATEISSGRIGSLTNYQPYQD